MKHESSWPISGPTHISTYPILRGGSLFPHADLDESKEGGPGSGRHPGGGMIGSSDDKKTPTYTGGMGARLKVGSDIAKIHNDAFFDKRPLADDEKKKLNDLELKRRQILMYQSNEADHSKKWQDCVHDVQDKGEDVDPFAVCTTSLGHQSETQSSPLSLLSKGGKIKPMIGLKSEADSSSSNTQVLRGKKNEGY
jgi:hypothetical protein